MGRQGEGGGPPGAGRWGGGLWAGRQGRRLVGQVSGKGRKNRSWGGRQWQTRRPWMAVGGVTAQGRGARWGRPGGGRGWALQWRQQEGWQGGAGRGGGWTTRGGAGWGGAGWGSARLAAHPQPASQLASQPASQPLCRRPTPSASPYSISCRLRPPAARGAGGSQLSGCSC